MGKTLVRHILILFFFSVIISCKNRNSLWEYKAIILKCDNNYINSFDAAYSNDTLPVFSEQEYKYALERKIISSGQSIRYYGLIKSLPNSFIVQIDFNDTTQLCLLKIKNGELVKLKPLSTYYKYETGYIRNSSSLYGEYLTKRYKTVSDNYKTNISDSLFVLQNGHFIDVSNEQLPRGTSFSWSLDFLKSQARPIKERAFTKSRYQAYPDKGTYDFIKKSFIKHTDLKLLPESKLRLPYYFEDHPLLFIAEIYDSLHVEKLLISIDTVKKKPDILLKLYQSPMLKDSLETLTESEVKQNYIRISQKSDINNETVYYLSDSKIINLVKGDLPPDYVKMNSLFFIHNQTGKFRYSIDSNHFNLKVQTSGKLKLKTELIERFNIPSGPCYSDSDEYFEYITIDLLGTNDYQETFPPFKFGEYKYLFVQGEYMSNVHDFLLCVNAKDSIVSATEISHHMKAHYCYSIRTFDKSTLTDSINFTIKAEWEFFYPDMNLSGNTEGVFTIYKNGSKKFQISKTYSSDPEHNTPHNTIYQL